MITAFIMEKKNECEYSFFTAPFYSTIRVNIGEFSLSKLQIVEQVLNLVGRGFEVDFHLLFEEIIVIYQKETRAVVAECNLPPKKTVIVGADCGNAVLRGSDVFCPGVVAISGLALPEEEVHIYADITGSLSRGTKSVTELAILHPEQFVFVGRGILKVPRESLFGSDRAQNTRGLAVEVVDKTLPSLSRLPPKFFFPQNFPSLICVHVLDPKPSDLILDMCAAPGGKTGHIAYLIKRNKKAKDSGRVVAIDRTISKVAKIREHLSDWNLQSEAVSFCADSSNPEFVRASLSDPLLDQNFQLQPAIFDKILLDAPCSGLGKRPYIQRHLVMHKLGKFHTFQRKFVKNAVGLLKPGGVLVYSTCTTLIEENEDQVQWILETFPTALKLIPCEPNFGKSGRKESRLAQSFDSLSMVQYFPPCPTEVYSSHPCEGDTIGFFIAKFVKL